MFIVRRALIAVLVTMTVVTISFTLTRLSGDLAIAIAGPQATQEDVDIVRKAYGLDKPLTVQFFNWVISAASGDLGESYMYHEPVSKLIGARLPITLTLGLTGLTIAILTAIPLGIIAAIREGSLVDRGIMMIAVIGQAMPSFWLGLTLIIFFGLKLQWFPISGVETWHGFVLPGIVLSFSAIPALMRLTRSGMVDALASDYIRTARAKGLPGGPVVLRHALRNALLPVVSLFGLQMGALLSGTVLLEQVFGVPGIGQELLNAVRTRDYPMVQGITVVAGVLVILTNLIVDISYGLIDPRVKTA